MAGSGVTVWAVVLAVVVTEAAVADTAAITAAVSSHSKLLCHS